MASNEDVMGGRLVRLSPKECADLVAAGEAILLDIREIPEFIAERVPGALLAPMQELVPGALPSQKDKHIILMCSGGIRTEKLAQALIAMGQYSEIAHMEGGLAAWKQEGLPTISPDPGHATT